MRRRNIPICGDGTMSRKIDGPLVPISEPVETLLDLSYEVPAKHCPECGRPLSVILGNFHGGVHSGVTWTLECAPCDRRYSWQDSWCSGDEDVPCLTCERQGA